MKTELVICGVPFGTPREPEALRQVKDLGFTSVQLYTFWREYEPHGRGGFDWRALDRIVELLRQAGLKFVPFLLMGPRYAAPDWWIADAGHAGLRCLEHGKESPIESVWNPAFRGEISRVLEAFAARYLPADILESVQPGIGGDYGEALFPALGNWPGAYHTHRGHWCGGDDARADFRRRLEERYDTLDALNRAWRSRYARFQEIEPFLPQRAPSRTAYFDLVAWYRDSMTRYAEFWMAACRRLFPRVPAYLCTGGADDEITTGALFAAQAKVAAKHGGGIRLTNEGNTFDYNFPLTAPTHAACRHYGAYYGLEPVGPMTEQGVRARMFGSAAFGNRQMFHYYDNLFDREDRPLPAAASVRRYAPRLAEQAVEKGIAFFWPVDQGVLQGPLVGEVRDALLHIRRQYPVSPVSEEMILDGALADFRCLVMIGAATTRAEVLTRIAGWVRQAGGQVTASGLCRDLELEPVPEFDALFGITPASEEAWGHHHQQIHAPAGFTNLGALSGFHADRGWMDLVEGTEKIACAVEGPGGGLVPEGNVTRTAPVSALFRRTYASGGQAIFYGGPVSFRRDPEALFADPGVFPRLLGDVCAMSGVRPLGTQDDEIARARVGGKLLVLRQDEMIEGDPCTI